MTGCLCCRAPIQTTNPQLAIHLFRYGYRTRQMRWNKRRDTGIHVTLQCSKLDKELNRRRAGGLLSLFSASF